MPGPEQTDIAVLEAIERLFARWAAYRAELGGLPWRSYEEDWRSACQQGEVRLGEIQWQPVRRASPASLANVASALDCDFHPAVDAYYGHWFAGSLPFSFKGMRVELVQPWNEADFERLQENLIGHLLMLRRLKLPETLFLATTRNESQLISLLNATGEVVLEQLGQGPRLVLAPDLARFLDRLSPLAD